MAEQRTVFKTPPAEAAAAVSLLDALSDSFAAMGFFMHSVHVDDAFAALKSITSHDVTFTAITTGAQSIARANAIKAAFNAHAAEATYTHEAADSTNAPSVVVDATDTATCSTLLADLKTKMNAHVIRAAAHRGVPGWVDAVTATPADEASNIATVNEMLSVWKRHVYSAFPDILRKGV
jgi:hypothetical protein